MYKSEAVLTKDIEYVKGENFFLGVAGQQVIVDVQNSIVLVNGDHVHIDEDEYLLTN